MSEEGKHLNALLGANLGLPDRMAFGTYTDAPNGAKQNGFHFAQTVMTLAEQLAVAPTP